MDYKEEIEKILENSREEIRKDVKEKIKEKIVDNLSWSLDDEIKETIKDVVETELQDEIKKAVVESKEEIVKGLKPAFIEIGAKIAEELQNKAIDNLQKSWKSEEVFRNLFD